MYQYSTHIRKPLSELEVFTGNILGRDGGVTSRRIRDDCITMSKHYDDHVGQILKWIEGDGRQGPMVDLSGGGYGYDDDAGNDGPLARSIACFALGMQESGHVVHSIGRLKSFVYVAAAVCLGELEKFGWGDK